MKHWKCDTCSRYARSIDSVKINICYICQNAMRETKEKVNDTVVIVKGRRGDHGESNC